MVVDPDVPPVDFQRENKPGSDGHGQPEDLVHRVSLVELQVDP